MNRKESNQTILKNQTFPKPIPLKDLPERGKFEHFSINDQIKQNLTKRDINFLFPIQIHTFNPIFEGKDVIGKERTGSGKTLAFALPLVEQKRAQNKFACKQGQKPLILVILPTRELAIQVAKEFELLKLHQNEYRTVTIYGGKKYDFQISCLNQGVEIVIGTPGRLKDLLQKDHLSLENLEALVLDETDRLLDMGFAKEIEEIVAYAPNDFVEKNQFLLFSATIPNWVIDISTQYMRDDYVFVDLIKNTDNQTSRTIDHRFINCNSEQDKINALPRIINSFNNCKSVIVFTETKALANELSSGGLQLKLGVLHGDISQHIREKTLQQFKNGEIDVIAATDVAARGLDIQNLDLIIQFSPPRNIESYIHRSGRTGRAGKQGTCITLVEYGEQQQLRLIEKVTQIDIKELKLEDLKEQEKGNKMVEDILNQKTSEKMDSALSKIVSQISPEECLKKTLALLGKFYENQKMPSTVNNIGNEETNFSSSSAQKKSPWAKESNNHSEKNQKWGQKNSNQNERSFKPRKNQNKDFQSSNGQKNDFQNGEEFCEKKLFVFNLSYQASEDEFREFLENQDLTVEDVFFLKKEGEFKGTGFVEFSSSQEAQQVLETEMDFQGRTVKFRPAKKRKNKFQLSQIYCRFVFF